MVHVFCISSDGFFFFSCVKFQNMSSSFKVMERTRKLLRQRAITPKIGKPELWFLCSARRLMVFNVCVKFHENMSSDFKVMERTRKLLTDTQRAITPKIGKPELWFMCSARRLMVFKVCVKFHENMSCDFKVMERTRKLTTHKGQ